MSFGISRAGGGITRRVIRAAIIMMRDSAGGSTYFAARDALTDEPRGIHRLRLPHIGKGPERRFLGIGKDATIKLTDLKTSWRRAKWPLPRDLRMPWPP
jgi:hypothetical protein